MPDPITRRAGVVGFVLAAAALSGACGDSPAAPTQGPAITTLAISGPATIAPESTGQFTAMLLTPDGVRTNVTTMATWFSTNPEVLEVDSKGLATARSRGKTEVRALYRALSLPVGVTVLEEGTFELSGRVTDAETGMPISGAGIDAQRADGPSLHATSDDQGRYGLYGVSGETQVSASANGLQEHVEHIIVDGATILDVALTPLVPAADLSGTWVLTILAPECSALPEPARIRRIAVSITQSGSQLVAQPFGPSLIVMDPLPGRILGEIVTLTLAYWPTDDFEPAYYALLESFDPLGYLGIWGTIQASVHGETVDGLLDGGLHFNEQPLDWVHRGCEGQVASVNLSRQ